MAAASGIAKGLDGIKADVTAVSTVGKHEAGLTYRGFAIEDLASSCEFEEVAHLLVRKSLPDASTLTAYKKRLAAHRALPAALLRSLEELPAAAHPMDVLRTACSVLGCLEPEAGEAGQADTAATCERLMPAFVSARCYWHHFSTSGTRITLNTTETDNMATAFLKTLRNDDAAPDPLHVRTIDAAFILYAEHDFNASTFSSRVVASTLSDTYSCICTGIGALRGPLHGGANEAVMYMLEDVKSVADGERKIRDMLDKKTLIMGFGHRIYKNGDPRNAIFKRLSKELADRPGGAKVLWEASDHIEALMAREKKMYPNADFFAASAYTQCGVPTPFFTPLFVVARTAGWCAHIMEQLGGNGKNKIIRPSSEYNGPAKMAFLPMAARSKL
jgi:2-methylcitrate synthase